MSRPTKKIVCRVRVDEQAKAVEFTWSEGSSSFKPYALEGDQVTDFRANVKAARDRLFGLVQQHEQPLDQRDPAAYHQACLELARAGRDLYNQIFDPAARDGENVDTIAGWLRAVTDSGQVESLEVICNGQPWFAPWNLVYDIEPDELAFNGGDGGRAGFAPFWGMRYNVCGGQPVDPLRRMPLPAKPQVLVVIDPVVLDDLRTYADTGCMTQLDRLERFLSAQGLTPVTSPAALAKALKQQRPHLIYWLGHAEPNALHLGPERIDQVALRNLLRNMVRVPGQTGGLVFLNACRTAESGDLGSFLNTFHNAEFSGLIGTEEQTLDSFANSFGIDVLERFFTPGTSIGGVLRDLRQTHGPLGLLYGAYCPPDLHVRLEEEPGARPDVRLADDPTITGGRLLGDSGAACAELEAVTHDRPLPEAPYLPLDSYGKGHRPLFVGRDDDITRFALILDRPESRVLVLHGESGVGKSSFLRAGLIPYLEEECIGYRFLRKRTQEGSGYDASPVLFVRATDDPAGQIAQALVDFAARPLEYPTPTGETVKADIPALLAEALGVSEPPTAATLAARLLASPPLLARLLGRLARAMPATLVLVIDQAEEMFTLARSPDEERVRGRVLEMIRQVGDRQGDFKLIVSLRTEYYGRLVSSLRRGLAEADGVREYLLTDLDVPAMVEVIRRPASREHLPHAAQVPFEKYRGFDFAEGVPEEIAHQVDAHGRTDGVALLLQVICAQLFERAMDRDNHRVTEDDLCQIGGFEGALSRHAERQIAELFPELKSDRERFQHLLTRLTLSQVDGTLTTALLREDDLRRRRDGRQSFDALLPRACDLRLLRTTTRRLDSGSDERLVSLGHDALAKVAHPWKQELERRAERIKWRRQAGLVAMASVMALACIGILIRSEEKERDGRRATAQAVENALTRARVFELEGRLSEAIQLVSAAQERLDFAAPNDPLKLQAAAQLKRYHDTEEDRRFVNELNEARIVGMEDMKSSDLGMIGSKANGSAYRRLFLAHGMDVEKLSADAVIRQLASRPPEVCAAAAAALDDWALQADHATGDRLRSIARQADRDPLRKTIRTAAAVKQTATLKSLARDLDVTIVPDVTLEHLGLALEQSRAYPEAVALHRRAQRHYSNDFRLNVGLGSALMAEGNTASTQEAISCFMAAVALRPNHPGVLAQLARALRKGGRNNEAVATLDEAIRIHSGNPDLFNVRGLSHASLQDHDRAISDYTAAIRLDPDFSWAFNNRGLSWRALKKDDMAIADYTEAIRLDPRYVHAYDNRGLAWIAKHEYDKAIADHTEAIRLDPKSAQARNHLAFAGAEGRSRQGHRRPHQGDSDKPQVCRGVLETRDRSEKQGRSRRRYRRL